MTQYQKRFREEVIAGDILAECDDHTLETELGMNMKIHRLKLLQIIRGDISAKTIIEGQHYKPTDISNVHA